MICPNPNEELEKPRAEKQFSAANGVWAVGGPQKAENKTKQ